MLSKHFLFLFFLSLVVVIKSISTLILFVHNFFGKITVLLFCSNYIIHTFGFSNPAISLFLSSQNLLPHATTLKFYLEYLVVIVLSFWSSKSRLARSILMDHEWMNFFSFH